MRSRQELAIAIRRNSIRNEYALNFQHPVSRANMFKWVSCVLYPFPSLRSIPATYFRTKYKVWLQRSYQNFEEVFEFDPECSYDEDSVRAISSNRKAIEGLFIDRILKLLQIKRRKSASASHTVLQLTLFTALKYYPPKSNSDLRNLHRAVCENTGPDHHKLSVFYYVLLDFDYPTGRRDLSTTFEKSSFLPQKYQIYMKGLWHMDHQEYEVCRHCCAAL